MDETTTRPAITPELVVEHGGELASIAGGGSPVPLSHRQDGLQIIERQGQIFAAVQTALLRLTFPEDWTVQKLDGAEMLTPGGSAVNKIRNYLAIEIDPDTYKREQVKRNVNGAEVIGYRVNFRARSLVYGGLSGLQPTQIPWIDLSTTRWADEDFVGRKTDAAGAIVRRDGVAALSSDLEAAADSAARNRAFRQITGLDKVPVGVAGAAWNLTPETVVRRAKKGYGFGTGGDRAAQGVAEEGVGDGALKLWEECLRQANGDITAAGAILQEITAYPAHPQGNYKAFAGVKSYQQITKTRSLESAWKKLRARSPREPGAEE